MAVALTIVAKERYINGFTLVVNAVFSGTYPAPTAGEPADFALLAGLNNRQPKSVVVTTKDAAVIITYDKTQKSFRIWCNSAGGANGVFTEHTNAAYIASVAADTQIEARASFVY